MTVNVEKVATAVVYQNTTQSSSTSRLTLTKNANENKIRTYVVPILLVSVPAFAVRGGEKFVSFDVISVSTRISLCCYTTQQMETS